MDVEFVKDSNYQNLYEHSYDILNDCLDSNNFKENNLLQNLAKGDALIMNDILTFFDVETQSSDNKLRRAHLLSLVKLANDKSSSEFLLKNFDFETLENAKLIVSAKLYNQKIVKLKTKLFYTQQKFNLLREESEGYAKLAANLLYYYPNSCSYDKMEDIISQLVGYFNLDPCRVLDIILEAFSLKISEYHGECIPFFIKLIHNYWNQPTIIIQLLAFRFNTYKAKDISIPYQLFDLVAQLIINGVIDYKDIYPHLYPDDLVLISYTTPILAQIKTFINQLPSRIKDLEEWQDNSLDPACLTCNWTFPQPDQSLATKLISLDNIISGQNENSNNNLHHSATNSPSIKTAGNSKIESNKDNISSNTNKREINTTDNYKALLARALMKFGSWQHILHIIKNYPHLYLFTDPKLLKYARLYLSYLITPLYQKVSKKLYPAYTLNLTTSSTTSPYLKILDRYSFYYKLSNSLGGNDQKIFKIDNLPQLFAFCGPLLDFLGPNVFDKTNLILVNQLLTIFEYYLTTSPTRLTHIKACENDENYCDILDTFKNCILPSLSQSSFNCVLSDAIGRCMKYIHYQHRYYLYSHWKRQFKLNTMSDEQILKYSGVLVSKIVTNIKSKYIMKRLSKDNVKQMGRQIGKLSHSNPGVLFEHVLNQIQNYENLINPVIDTLRYVTNLSFDVLIYCVIESMCSNNRHGNLSALPLKLSPTDDDPKGTVAGGDRDPWFVNICSFSGGLVRKYAVCDVTGLLTYSVNGLKYSINNLTNLHSIPSLAFSCPTPQDNESGDKMNNDWDLLRSPKSVRLRSEKPVSINRDGSELLLIVKELVHKMSGIEMNDTASTKDQLEALSGGDILRSEAGYYSQIRNTKRSSQRLKESLLNSDILIPLAILISQQRDCEIYNSVHGQSITHVGGRGGGVHNNNAHTSGGGGGDNDALHYSSLGSTPDPLSSDSNHVKLLGRLHDQAQDTLVQYVTFIATNFSVDEYVHLLPSLLSLINDYHLSFDAAFFIRRHSLSLTLKGDKYFGVLKHILKEEAENVNHLLPPKVWTDITPLFFITFWTFSRYDIYFPAEAYAREIAKIKHAINALDDGSSSNAKDFTGKKKKEKEKLNALVDKLKEEEMIQKEHVKTLHEIFEEIKFELFGRFTSRNDMLTQFLQKCIFPRVKFSVLDAIYSAEFIKMLHYLKVPSFATLICLDRIFCDSTFILISLSENEAARYGIFLNCLMETALLWHSSLNIFEKNCSIYPGFKVLKNYTYVSNANTSDENVSSTPGSDGKSVSKGSAEQTPLSYEEYRHICSKWHYKLTRSLVSCLESGIYVAIRNSLIVLTKLLPSYPIMSHLGNVIEKRVENIKTIEKDNRADLYALALSYSGLLKTKKPKFIPEIEFHKREKETSSSSKKGNKTSESNSKDVATAKLSNTGTVSSPPSPNNTTTPSSSTATSETSKVNSSSNNANKSGTKISPTLPNALSKKSPLLADPKRSPTANNSSKEPSQIAATPSTQANSNNSPRHPPKKSVVEHSPLPVTTATLTGTLDQKTTTPSPKRFKGSISPHHPSTTNTTHQVKNGITNNQQQNGVAELNKTNLTQQQQLQANHKGIITQQHSPDSTRNVTTFSLADTSSSTTAATSTSLMAASAKQTSTTSRNSSHERRPPSRNLDLKKDNKRRTETKEKSSAEGRKRSVSKTSSFKDGTSDYGFKNRSSSLKSISKDETKSSGNSKRHGVKSSKDKKSRRKERQLRAAGPGAQVALSRLSRRRHHVRGGDLAPPPPPSVDNDNETPHLNWNESLLHASQPPSTTGKGHKHRHHLRGVSRGENNRSKLGKVEDAHKTSSTHSSITSKADHHASMLTLTHVPQERHLQSTIHFPISSSVSSHQISHGQENEDLDDNRNKVVIAMNDAYTNGGEDRLGTATSKRLKTRRDSTESTAQALLLKARERKFKTTPVASAATTTATIAAKGNLVTAVSITVNPKSSNLANTNSGQLPGNNAFNIISPSSLPTNKVDSTVIRMGGGTANKRPSRSIISPTPHSRIASLLNDLPRDLACSSSSDVKHRSESGNSKYTGNMLQYVEEKYNRGHHHVVSSRLRSGGTTRNASRERRKYRNTILTPTSTSNRRAASVEDISADEGEVLDDYNLLPLPETATRRQQQHARFDTSPTGANFYDATKHIVLGASSPLPTSLYRLRSSHRSSGGYSHIHHHHPHLQPTTRSPSHPFEYSSTGRQQHHQSSSSRHHHIYDKGGDEQVYGDDEDGELLSPPSNIPTGTSSLFQTSSRLPTTQRRQKQRH